MEPLFFKAENIPPDGDDVFYYFTLQWSRFFSKRKIELAPAVENRLPGASMEPLFFKAENLVRSLTEHDLDDASMEPLFFKAENVGSSVYAAHNGGQASMEPLFFKAENEDFSVEEDRDDARFNGAAFFQSGKYVNNVVIGDNITQGASMEPLFFKAENVNFCKKRAVRVNASMEPLFFKAENLKLFH